MDATKNRRGRFGLLVLLLLAGIIVLTSAGTVSAAPAVIYVRAAATGANNGTSWADAYTSLQSALGAASSGEQIWVAAGTYYPGVARTDTFTLKNGVAIYGGFPAAGGDWADRDPGANVTTLHGDGDRNGGTRGAYHLVTTAAGTDATAVLDGFTVRGGNTEVDANTKGGGLLIFGSPTLADLVVTENYSCYCGAGMHIEGGSPTLTDITFCDNVANWYGGGLSIRNASPTMSGITFLDNRVASGGYGGGGLHVVGGATTLTDALFARNRASYGAGLSMASIVPGGDQMGGSGTLYPGTSILLTNVVFAANTATYSGGGMNANGGAATLVNTDFASNQATYEGGGLRLGTNSGWGTGDATVTLTNSILWGNTVAGAPQQIQVLSGGLSVDHSDVQGGCAGLTGVTCGAGNIQSYPYINSGDPSAPQDVDWDGLDEVVGTADDGVRLATGSPAVDTGSDAALPVGVSADLLGAPRLQDGDGDGTATVDMGALEARLPVTGGVVYVDADATGANDGTSWADAFTDLQAGLALAGPALAGAGESTQVWVAAGTYAPTLGRDPRATFLLRNGVVAYGGFAGTETSLEQRDPAVNVTVLSGDLSANDATAFTSPSDHVYHVVSAYGWVDDTAVLDGFAVTGGIADGDFWIGQGYGAGVYNHQGSPTLRNLTVTGNEAGSGGGMYSALGAPTLDDVAFSANHATLNGGGLYVLSGAATLSDVLFESNTTTEGFGGGLASANPDDVEPPTPTLSLSRVAFRGNVAQFGGGFAARAGHITIRDSVFETNHASNMGGGMCAGEANYGYTGTLSLNGVAFKGNDATNTPATGYECGGGMTAIDAAATLTNVLFSGNASFDGGGLCSLLYYTSLSPTLTNVTFGGNSAVHGGAISTYGGATVTNSILWGDGGGEINGPVTVTYSTVQGGYAGTGNGSSDPLFLTPVVAAAPTTTGNLRLRAASPALNAGLTGAVPAGVTTDLDGCVRVFGTAVDRGAYERADFTAPTTSASGADDLWHNEAVTLRLTATDNAGGSGVARTEYWVDGGEWTAGTSVTIAAPADGANDGFHTVAFRSTDQYGNVENTNLCTVRIDTQAPSASDDHDGLWYRSFTLHVSGVDGASGVDHVTYSIDGGPEQTVAEATCQVLLRTWKRGGNSGVHTVDYRAVDRAGNETAGSCEVLLDARAPITKDDAPRDASGSPIPQIGPVVVHLTAADQPGLSGVATTFWSLDGGAWQQGASVSVPADGATHWICYYSVDQAGNQEYWRWSAVIATAPRVPRHAVGMRSLR